MDQLQDLRDLVAELREGNRIQKEKDKRDGWTKYVSLSMIFVAVLATVASGKGGGFSSGVMRQLDEATFNQAKASDAWSYYEAKAMKQTLAENERELLKRTVLDEAGRKYMDGLSARILRYDKEKADIQKEAAGFEAARDEARRKASVLAELGQRMGLASSLFQISVAMGGVCLIMKRRWIWWLSMALGVAALVRMVSVLYFP